MKSENEYADAVTDVSEALRDWLAEQQIPLNVAGPALLNVAAFATVHLAEGNREEIATAVSQAVGWFTDRVDRAVRLYDCEGERVDQPHH